MGNSSTQVQKDQQTQYTIAKFFRALASLPFLSDYTKLRGFLISQLHVPLILPQFLPYFLYAERRIFLVIMCGLQLYPYGPSPAIYKNPGFPPSPIKILLYLPYIYTRFMLPLFSLWQDLFLFAAPGGFILFVQYVADIKDGFRDVSKLQLKSQIN